MRALLTAFAILFSRPVQAQRADGILCRTAIAATERTTGVPDRLMQAVSIMESGRRDPAGGVTAWPWTINVEGVGEVYESKAEVIAAVLRHQARGARSIDVGCLQVNLMHHPGAFASLDEAFDPAANARYAARFLQQLLVQTGSWPRAVAGYHSLTPEVGGEYARKVLAIWAQPEPRPAQATLPVPAPSPGPAQGAATPPVAPSSRGRILPMAGSPAPTMTGRGLDSYRAIPLRAVVFRRS